MAHIWHTLSHSLAFRIPTKQPRQAAGDVRFLHGHVKPFGRCSKLSVMSASFKSASKHETPKLLMVSDSDQSLYSLDVKELLKSDDKPATRKQVSLPDRKWNYIRGRSSCNGLVLMEDVNGTIFFLNPTTQELFRIPDSPIAVIPGRESRVTYGFGYDSSTNDYKVICISSVGGPAMMDVDFDEVFVSLYSLRNNSWKNLPYTPYFYWGDGFLFNQNLYWLVSRVPDLSITVVAFGLANGEVSEIQLPEEMDSLMVVVGGKLGIVKDCVKNCEHGCELWVMEEYGVAESWTRLCPLEFDRDKYGVKASCLVEGRKLVLVLGTDVDGKLVLYDVDERRCIYGRIQGGPTRFKYEHVGVTYVETLESPKSFITSP